LDRAGLDCFPNDLWEGLDVATDNKLAKKRKPSWRDVLDIHPAADLFPLMVETDPAALKELGEDIKKNGLQFPVTLGRRRDKEFLIDGRNRLDALELAGFTLIDYRGTLDPTLGLGTPCPNVIYTLSDLTDAEITALVISANIHRRHLAPDDKRDLIAKLLKLHPEKSDRAIAAGTTLAKASGHRSVQAAD
jgi:ParB-like chromosome segregation protein Spo0J